MRVILVAVSLLPALAFAQAPLPPESEPSECVTTTTTTTTTRCSGDAAPYAAPPAPPPSPPPRLVVLDARRLAGPGWQLVQSPDGSWWREKKTKAIGGLWGSGLALFLGANLGGGIVGAATGGYPFGFVPFAGPIMMSIISNGGVARGLWVVDGLAQVSGLVMFIAGLGGGPERIARQPVTVGPTAFVGGGAGVAVSARF